MAAAAVGVAVPLLGWAVITGRTAARTPVVDNLTRGLLPSGAARGRHLAKDPRSAGRTPWLDSVLKRVTPGRFVERLERQLSLAGRPAAWPVRRLLGAKVILGLTAGMVGFLVVNADLAPGRLLFAAGITTAAYLAPDLLLYSRGQERQKTIQLELADTLDQMTIAVEAGLGFESAMARAGKNGKGPLAEELVRTLQDMQVGQSRREAFRGLASRTTVPDLRRFITAVLQADAYGIAIADVLRTQAGEMRLTRRQRAEEKAMQIPVKVIFPLVLFILPTLFLVLLGPAAMDIMDAFGSGNF
jgi:tight adherence protein C